MASKFCRVLSVVRQAPKLVAPARPTPREIKQLSDVDDQEILRFHAPLLFFYRNNPLPAMDCKDPVKVIRQGLSKALGFYHPLAGRLKEGSNHKLMVDCTGEGVWFTEADANVKFEYFGDEIQIPSPYLDQLLYNIPGSDGILGSPLLLIQVTRLICGGFILALRLNHTVGDAFGMVQFMRTLEEMIRGENPPSLLPIWQREILNARDPPRITCIHHEYQHIDSAKDIILDMNSNETTHESFYFGPEEIIALRNHLPLNLRNSSTFELLTACLWRCRTIALEPDDNEIVRLSVVVNARGKHCNNLFIPPGYYGNAFAFPAVCSKADDLCRNPLEYAVELVKKAKAKMSEEYLRSMADLMVMRGRPKCTSEGMFIVSDNTRIGFDEIDLGWGKPVFAGIAGAISIISFYVKYKRRDGETGILVPICLPSSSMKRFQEEIKKMTQGPLN